MSAKECTVKLGGSRVFLFLPLNPNTMKAEKSLIEKLCALKTKGKFLNFLKFGLQSSEFDAYSLTLPESSLVQHVIVSGNDLVLIKICQEHRGEEVIANDCGTFYRGEEYVYGSGDEVWKSPILEMYTARLAIEHIVNSLVFFHIHRCLCIYITPEKIINELEQSHFWEMCGVRVVYSNSKVRSMVGECKPLKMMESEIEGWIESSMKNPDYEEKAKDFFDDTRFDIHHHYFCLERNDKVQAAWNEIKSRYAQKQGTKVQTHLVLDEVKPEPETIEEIKHPVYKQQEIEFPADGEPLEEVQKNYMCATSEEEFDEILRDILSGESEPSSDESSTTVDHEEVILNEPVNVDFDAPSEVFVEREFEEQEDVEEELKKSEAEESSTIGRYLRHFGKKVLKRIMPDETGVD